MDLGQGISLELQRVRLGKERSQSQTHVQKHSLGGPPRTDLH